MIDWEILKGLCLSDELLSPDVIDPDCIHYLQTKIKNSHVYRKDILGEDGLRNGDRKEIRDRIL